MKIDAYLTGPLGEAATVAREAHRSGYDGLWSAELDHDPFLPIGLAAAASGSLELGTSIAVAFARLPMTVANAAWDLQSLSEGRFVLGLGSQVRAHIERRFSMPWSQPVARMREFVLALRAIWDTWQNGTSLEFRGEFYRHTLMTPAFDPGPLRWGPPRIYLAAVGPAMTTVASEVADGLLVHPFITADYLRAVTLNAVDSTLAAAGRPRSGFDVRYAPFTVTGSNEAELEAASAKMRGLLAFYASTAAYRPVLDFHGWGTLQSELNVLARRGEWTAMSELIDDEVLQAFAVVAPIDELPAAYGRHIKGLCDRTAFTPPVGDPDQLGHMVAAVRTTAQEAGRT